MTYDAQRIAIQSRFKTEWETAHPTVPIIYDNVKGKEPDGGFVQLRILNGASELAGLGLTKLYRYPGVISVDIFFPLRKGIKAVDQYADTIDGIFRGQSFSGILCRAAERQDLGEAGHYWRVNVSVPFQRDKLQTP